MVFPNCVNLSPNKARVFWEAFRILRSGGRLVVSDVVAKSELDRRELGPEPIHSMTLEALKA